MSYEVEKQLNILNYKLSEAASVCRKLESMMQRIGKFVFCVVFSYMLVTVYALSEIIHALRSMVH